MAKTAHTTTAPAPAQPGFIDPTTLPAEYAMRVRGDCLAPAINGGDSVLVDQRQPYSVGDLVCVFLKPERSRGSTNVGLKRLVMNMMPGVTYPYQAHPDSNIMPVLVCEQDNPAMQYTVAADQILAVHRCMGLVPNDVALYDVKTGEPEYRRAVASAGWSRRHLLAGAVTVLPASALATLPALSVAADHADIDLFALGREYDVIYAKMKDAERRIDLVAPPRPEPIKPEALKVRPGDVELGLPKPFDYGVDEPDTYGWREVDQLRGKAQVRSNHGPVKLERIEYADVVEIVNAAIAYSTARDEPQPEAQARADEIVSAFDAYIAERKSPEYDSEAVAEEEIDAYHDELDPVVAAIAATRAVTIDGLLVKARAVLWIYRDDPEQLIAEANGTDDELLRSITADLWAMQEGQS